MVRSCPARFGARLSRYAVSQVCGRAGLGGEQPRKHRDEYRVVCARCNVTDLRGAIWNSPRTGQESSQVTSLAGWRALGRRWAKKCERRFMRRS